MGVDGAAGNKPDARASLAARFPRLEQTFPALIPPEQLRALLVAEADLGERIMRALILRRVSLIQAGVGGPVLIGPSDSAGVIRLQGFLTRNGIPHHLLDPERDHDAAEVIARYSPSPSDWPLVI